MIRGSIITRLHTRPPCSFFSAVFLRRQYLTSTIHFELLAESDPTHTTVVGRMQRGIVGDERTSGNQYNNLLSVEIVVIIL